MIQKSDVVPWNNMAFFGQIQNTSDAQATHAVVRVGHRKPIKKNGDFKKKPGWCGVARVFAQG